MGISASQARLLTITARLTSNEYESQQISNAKMRLATQSEQASSDYISALNTTQLLFTTYDASGSAVNENLTANVLYQYADMKNQYAITNASGQIMVSSQDAYNFEKAENLDEFLGLYGITKEYKTESLQANMEALAGDEYYDMHEGDIVTIPTGTYHRIYKAHGDSQLAYFYGAPEGQRRYGHLEDGRDSWVL